MKYRIIIFISILTIYIGILFNNKTFTIENKIKKDNNSSIEVLEKYGYVPGYSCDKITVVDENGKYEGRYNLEDYVAAVVSGETHILDDEATFEAMSVAARTYALYVTNNCKYSIINSESHQVMDKLANVSNKIKNATAKTKGQVLVYNNKLVKSEYDSFYMGNGFYCDRNYCYSTYKRVGDSKEKTHRIKVPATWKNDLSGGHGKGLSQYGAKYLSEQGYDYIKILKYFYADGVEIKTIIKPNLSGLVLDNGFVTRNSRPLRDNPFYYINKEVMDNSLEGESIWYAVSRANEILGSTSNKKTLSYFDDSNKYCNLISFNKSFDYNKPKIGSIISWGNHLAIIEKVNNDSVDISEAYIGLGYYGVEYSFERLNKNGKYYNESTNKKDRKYNCEQNNSGCFQRINNIKISDLRKRWGYNFKCYIYLID